MLNSDLLLLQTPPVHVEPDAKDAEIERDYFFGRQVGRWQLYFFLVQLGKLMAFSDILMHGHH